MTDVSQPRFLTVDDLLDAVFNDSPVPTELVHVPELGVSRGGVWVEVRGMTGEEKAAYIDDISAGQDEGKTNIRAVNPAMLRASVFVPAFDDDGTWLARVSTTKVFGGRSDAQVNALPGAALDRITDVTAVLSGFRRDRDVAEVPRPAEEPAAPADAAGTADADAGAEAGPTDGFQ